MDPNGTTDYANLFLQISIAISALGTVLGAFIAFLQQWRENRRAPLRDKAEEMLQEAQFTSQLQLTAMQLVETMKADVQGMRVRVDKLEEELSGSLDINRNLNRAVTEIVVIIDACLARLERIQNEDDMRAYRDFLKENLTHALTLLDAIHAQMLAIEKGGDDSGSTWSN